MKNLKSVIVILAMLMMSIMTSCVKNETIVDVDQDQDTVVIEKGPIFGSININTTFDKNVSNVGNGIQHAPGQNVVNREATMKGINRLTLINIPNDNTFDEKEYVVNYVEVSSNPDVTEDIVLKDFYIDGSIIRGEAFANKFREIPTYPKNYNCVKHIESIDNETLIREINSADNHYYKHYLEETPVRRAATSINLDMYPVNDYYVIHVTKSKLEEVKLIVRSNDEVVGIYDNCSARTHEDYMTIFDGLYGGNEYGRSGVSAFENLNNKITLSVKVKILGIWTVLDKTYDLPELVGGRIHIVNLDIEEEKITPTWDGLGVTFGNFDYDITDL